jgi:hypothetical protein
MTNKTISNNPIKRRGLGLLPDTKESRVEDAIRRRFKPRMGVSAGTEWIVKTPKFIRDQAMTESCAGQSVAAAVDGQIKGPPWCSARSLWLDSLRRDGLPPDSNFGTKFSYILTSLTERGWDPYRENEDSSPLPTDWQHTESLEDEMFAADHRQPGKILRSRIVEENDDRVKVVASALADPKTEVVYGGGTRTPYINFRGDTSSPAQILDTRYLGGFDGGHGRRLIGFYRNPSNGEFVFIEQNSWGEHWGGCLLPSGRWLYGCCLVSKQVVIEAWDVHVLELA